MILQPGFKEYSLNLSQHKIYLQCSFNPDSDEVILFLHGLACSSDSFRDVWKQHYFPDKSILTVDIAGFGRSSENEDFSYKMEDQAGLIEKLLEQLPDWKFHIAAHSMGGAIALLFSQVFYSRVLSFTNIEGNLVSEDCGLLSQETISRSFDVYKNRLYKKHVNAFKDHDQLHFEQSTPAAIYRSAESLVQWSDSGRILEKFRELRCRKSYFYGEENKDMAVISELDFAKQYMISNSGHGMMTENPEEFYTKLAEFIRD